MPTFFIRSTDIVGKTVVLSGPLFQHLVKSLRTQIGESLVFNDDRGTRYFTTVSQITRDVLRCDIQGTHPLPPATASPIILGQALLKGEKMTWIIQKATELGVASIVPLLTDRVIPRVSQHQIPDLQERWKRVGIEAAQQSERWTPPSIEPLQPLKTFLKTIPAGTLTIILAERTGAQSLSHIPIHGDPQAGIVIIVGPEGGWSQRELEEAQNTGFTPTSLGPLILRAETAALTAVAIIQSRLQMI
jgi:16S rRNA (uracil1498-N3)-methyltransferase